MSIIGVEDRRWWVDRYITGVHPLQIPWHWTCSWQTHGSSWGTAELMSWSKGIWKVIAAEVGGHGCDFVTAFAWSVTLHSLDEHVHVIMILLKRTECLKYVTIIMFYGPSWTLPMTLGLVMSKRCKWPFIVWTGCKKQQYVMCYFMNSGMYVQSREFVGIWLFIGSEQRSLLFGTCLC